MSTPTVAQQTTSTRTPRPWLMLAFGVLGRSTYHEVWETLAAVEAPW